MSAADTKLGKITYAICASISAIIVVRGSEFVGLAAKSSLIAMFTIAISALGFFYWPYFHKLWMRAFMASVIMAALLIIIFVPSDRVQMSSFAFYPLGLGLYILLALGLEAIGRHFERHPL